MLLAVDTSTLEAGVALIALDGRVLAARRARVTVHSELLLGLIEDTLADANVGLDRLVAIACGAGPGSFTGLRIGLATAKGLCLALDRPLLLVSSLSALASRAPTPSLAVACIDAFKGEVYAGFYRVTVLGHQTQTMTNVKTGAGVSDPRAARAVILDGEELVIAADRLAEMIKGRIAQGPVHLVGDVLERWPVLAVDGLETTDPAPPDASDVARLALARHLRGERDDLASAIPSYIRPSEAEVLAGRRDS